MASVDGGVLLIQEDEEEGVKTYSWWLPVLSKKGTGCPDPEIALNEADLAIQEANPSVMLEVTNEQIQFAKVFLAELQEKRKELQARVSSEEQPMQTPEEELMEEKDMCLRQLRWFLMTHPVEEHMGTEIKTVSFRPWRDTDNDGTLNCIPTLYSTKRIK